MENKLLIVEDNLEEREIACTSAKNSGFRNIVTATNLEEALHYIPGVQAVVTDLFFPNGDVNVDSYVQRILPLYVEHAQQRGKLPRGNVHVLRALEVVSNVFDMTPEQYVENVLSKRYENQRFLVDHARASLPNFASKQNIQDFLEDESNLPLGILVTEVAQEYQIPSVIVTSGGGHGGLLQPIMDLVKVPYETHMDGNHKNWDSGLSKLLIENPRLR